MKHGRITGLALMMVGAGVTMTGAAVGGCKSSTGNPEGADGGAGLDGTFDIDGGADDGGGADVAANPEASARDGGPAAQDASIADASVVDASTIDAPMADGPVDASSLDAGGGDGNACPHTTCTPGAALPASCQTAPVCTLDPYCCNVAWDLTCINEQTGCSPLTDGGYVALGGTEQSVIQVGVGSNVMCAVTSTHDLYCWGDDGNAAVGDGRFGGWTPFPRKVASGVTSVVGGEDGVCAIFSDKGLRCWGRYLEALIPTGGQPVTSPPSTPQLTDVVFVEKGLNPGGVNLITCAITSDGGATCFGGLNSDQSEIGPGVLPYPNGPGPVVLADAGSLVTGSFRSFASGAAQSCLLTTNGVPVCWGFNPTGLLGNTQVTQYTDQTCIPGGPGGVTDCAHPITNVAKVAIDNDATCLLFADHSVKCLGGNGAGALAQGTVTSTNVTYPQPATALPPVLDIAGGYGYFCAAPVDTTQPVLCWGQTTNGQLGPNTPSSGPPATPVTVPGMTGVTSLACRWTTMCAIKQDGSLWCWGDDDYSNLGDGLGVTAHPTPVRVPVLSFP